MTLTDLPVTEPGEDPRRTGLTMPAEAAWAAGAVGRRIMPLLRDVDTASARFRRRLARCGAQAHRVARRQGDLATAQQDTRGAQARLDGENRLPRGPYDGPTRPVPTWVYAVVILLAWVLGYAIDRGALLVLELPLDLTRAIALMAVVVQLLAAHFGGHLLRRRHDAVDPLVRGRAETLLAATCLVGAFTVSAVLALIRGLSSGLLAGALFLVLGVLDMAVTVVAAYLHTHEGLSAVERARRHERYLRWRLARATRWLRRGVARARAAHDTTRRAAVRLLLTYRQGLGAAADMWQRNNPATPFPQQPDPAWIDALEQLAVDEESGERAVQLVLGQEGVCLEELRA